MMQPTTEFEAQLTSLTDLNKDKLQIQWRKLYRTHPPPSISRDLLVRAVAFKLQEQIHGGLTNRTRRKLRSWTSTMEEDGKQTRGLKIMLKPGASFVREWHGNTYRVLVLDEGFEYDGRRYTTLTKIALQITGTHWSGPRFFGLKRPAKPFSTGDGGKP